MLSPGSTPLRTGEVKQLAHLDVGAESVEVPPGARVKAKDFATSCRELELRAFLLPVRAKGVPVADEGQRYDDGNVAAVAYVPFHGSEVLVRLQTDLDRIKTNQ